MSEQNAYEQLGVGENASFEEIQDAKKRLIQQHGNDSKKVETIESAYDTIIMDRLRLRQEGKIKVPERIRFPERAPEAPANVKPSSERQPSAQWLQQFIDNPSQADILLPTGIFLVLATIAVFTQAGDISQTVDPSQPASTSLLPLLMSLGFIANIYFLNRKEGRFGRAFLMSLAALFVGIGLGTGLAQLMVAQGGVVLGVEKLASTITFCLFWLASCFLR